MNQKQKGFAPVVIVLVALIFAGAVGASYYFINKNIQAQKNNKQNQAQNSNSLLSKVDISGWNSYEVIIKDNLTDKSKSDIYLKNKENGNEAFLITIVDVNKNHYNAAEYHNGNLFIVRRTGGDEGYLTNPNWTDELWKYSQQEQGVSIFSNRGLDFRASEDAGFIAIIGSGENNISGEKLAFIKNNGEIIKSFDWNQLGIKNGIDPIGWSDSNFWIADSGPGGLKVGIIKLNVQNFEKTYFDVSSLSIVGRPGEFDLNPKTEKIVFDNRPFNFDADSEREYQQSKTKVDLIVYDLNTKLTQLIATSAAKSFSPRWISDDKVEYDNPNGEGRITTKIGQTSNNSDVYKKFGFYASTERLVGIGEEDLTSIPSTAPTRYKIGDNVTLVVKFDPAEYFEVYNDNYSFTSEKERYTDLDIYQYKNDRYFIVSKPSGGAFCCFVAYLFRLDPSGSFVLISGLGNLDGNINKNKQLMIDSSGISMIEKNGKLYLRIADGRFHYFLNGGRPSSFNIHQYLLISGDKLVLANTDFKEEFLAKATEIDNRLSSCVENNNCNGSLNILSLGEMMANYVLAGKTQEANARIDFYFNSGKCSDCGEKKEELKKDVTEKALLDCYSQQ